MQKLETKKGSLDKKQELWDSTRKKLEEFKKEECITSEVGVATPSKVVLEEWVAFLQYGLLPGRPYILLI